MIKCIEKGREKKLNNVKVEIESTIMMICIYEWNRCNVTCWMLINACCFLIMIAHISIYLSLIDSKLLLCFLTLTHSLNNNQHISIYRMPADNDVIYVNKKNPSHKYWGCNSCELIKSPSSLLTYKFSLSLII